jgi:hypothetical protein
LQDFGYFLTILNPNQGRRRGESFFYNCPISLQERRTRINKAQRLMAENNIAALVPDWHRRPDLGRR